MFCWWECKNQPRGLYDESGYVWPIITLLFWSSKNWEKCRRWKLGWAPGCTRLLAGTSTLRMVEKSPSPPFLTDSKHFPGCWITGPGLRQTLSGSVRQMLSFPKRKCWFHTEPDMGRDLPVLGRPSCLWLGRPNHPPKIEGFPVFPLGIGTGHKTKHFFPYWHGHKLRWNPPFSEAQLWIRDSFTMKKSQHLLIHFDASTTRWSFPDKSAIRLARNHPVWKRIFHQKINHPPLGGSPKAPWWNPTTTDPQRMSHSLNAPWCPSGWVLMCGSRRTNAILQLGQTTWEPMARPEELWALDGQ